MGVRIRVAGVVGVVLAAVAASAGVVRAEPGARPSVLVLTVAGGDSLESAASQRVVLLLCAPVVWGTHPKAGAACDELGAAGGDFTTLQGPPLRVCTQDYNPVTIAADGTWNGTSVRYRQTYPNACAMGDRSVSVFEF
ncbi:subtilase-type protease inhibitor [Nocardia sp. CDC159]|uniref:Subtilase-type protease inhibitor n=1 Tax=Nocardia pulmonis TaxID=2951408 RepID=A0A9X2IZ50_9NOCA|nr:MULTISPECIES: subtilase-type protease inhibitor [Nocardia]MCM6776379.1 subtilase-type protease inhibitor [Nocardia pulmonis]MCM6788803.1 subtilase-type protease inhibitor [Nocardia sp. CDC159]